MIKGKAFRAFRILHAKMANGNSDEENWEKIEKENEEDDPKLVEGDEEEGWVKIYVVDCEELDVQTNKIDKENDDGHQEVKDCEKIDEENDFEDGEEEEEKIDDDRSENIDKENEDEDGEEEEEEKIDDRSEKIGNDAGVVKVEECLEFDYGNRNRDYWERNWNHWIYKRERMTGADYPSFCSYGPISIDDPFKWQAVILGPPNSPYEDGFFFLAIDLPSDYPISPPTITFKTKVLFFFNFYFHYFNFIFYFFNIMIINQRF